MCPSLTSNHSSHVPYLLSWKSFKKTVKKVLPKPLTKAITSAKSKLHSRVIPTIKLKLHLPLKKQRSKIIFEVHLAEHCNLNCAGCSHFSPIAQKKFVDVENFRRDLVRMGEIFSHECEEIHLLGGEPLLHKDINTLIKITRDNFTHGRILVVTNGILLMSMNDDFWRACHDNDIIVAVTHYPIKLDTEGIRTTARSFGVTLRWYGSEEEKTLFRKNPIDLTGSQDSRESFALCTKGSVCNNLSNGRLYSCAFAAYVHHFNEAFGKNVVVDPEDYIDIHSDVDANTILKRLSEPVPICRYCNVKAIDYNVKWHTSHRDASEWL